MTSLRSKDGRSPPAVTVSHAPDHILPTATYAATILATAPSCSPTAFPTVAFLT